MSPADLGTALAYLGSAIGVAMVIPQILRIVRHPHMGGVSPWTWAITVVSCTTWIAYGVRTGSMPQIPGNILLVSGAVAIVLLVPAAWSRAVRAVGLALTTVAMVLVSTLLEPEVAGFFALAIGLTGMWPQVFETVWLRRGMGPSAISLTSQLLKVVSQLCWLAFAVLTLDVPVLVAAIMTLSTNFVITGVEMARRRGADARPEPTRTRELVGAEA
ncbi:PQ-loop domain-containing transporter [Longivirga aurantiaca]|uniref:PQ-loop domain-containing transporter n=1 Tax=Longivirga aurantiaca TaxID=1837743 RepID=A0ABW1T4F9_9ACTN